MQRCQILWYRGRGDRHVWKKEGREDSKRPRRRIRERVRVARTEVYKFKELSKEAKQKALDKHRDINVDYNWWDFIVEDFSRSIKEDGIEIDVKTLSFDLYPKHVDLKKAYVSWDGIEKVLSKELKSKLAVFILDGNRLSFDLHYNNGSVEADFSVDNEDELSDDERKGLEELRDEIAGAVEEHVKDRLHKLLNDLENEYDDAQSDERVEETIEANDYEFKKEGERW